MSREQLISHIPHAQLHSSPLQIDFEDAHLHDLADGNHAEGVFDVAVGEFGDVDETVLFDADIDEGAEVDNVAHGALQEHARLQVFHFENVVAQDGRGQRVAWVKARLFQVFEDVVERGQADADFAGEVSPGGLLVVAVAGSGCPVALAAPQAGLQFDQLTILRDAFGWLLSFAVVAGWQQVEQFAGRVVAFGVDEGVVERLAAVGDLEEARRLHKGGGAETRNFQQLLARAEGAVFFAVLDDGAGNAGVDAGDVLEQGGGSGIDLDSGEVDAGDDDALSGRRRAGRGQRRRLWGRF